ncbi:glycosyltransferase family 2 protein [Rhodoferax sp. 4810]|nr:glycosyltransferase family 2 protein [Rhodoferax jenense]
MNLENSQLKMPCVSVVIPVRNGKPFIDEAIHSVLTQSYRDLELIIVNDGSNDDDYDRFSELDHRIRVIHLPGTGVSSARNVGMKNSKGRYIAFLDADDIWFPGKLTAQIRYLELHPNVWVVYGGFRKWVASADGKFAAASSLSRDCSDLIDTAPEKSGWLYTRLLTGLLVGMNTAVIRRSVYESIGGFNESMRQGEDYDFWLKSSRLAEMHSLAGEVALYRIHGNSAMHRHSKQNHLSVLLVAARMRWGLKNPDGLVLSEREFRRRLCEVAFDHGYTNFWKGNKQIAIRSFWSCLKGGYRPTRSIAYIVRCLMLPSGSQVG